jgi:signal transduction histidine kinase
LFSEFRRWSSIRLETITTGLSEIEPATPLADHLFRMVQELLANARKHSQATRVRLAVQYLPPLVRLKYQDDGHGIPPEEASIQPSLKSLEFRTKLLQGTLAFSPSPGGGLSIVIEVPHGPTARS